MNDSITVLNDLIETCKDGEEGFKQAAEGVKDAQLRALFLQYSQQRAQFASELRALVSRLGGKAEQSGSVAGAVHRGWINIKSAVTGKDEDAIIAECERGEDVAKADYEKALTSGLPADVVTVVQRQAKEVKEAHDRIRAMEVASNK